MSRAATIARTLARAEQLDREWQGKIAQTAAEKPLYTPWMPFQLYEFIPLLAEAQKELPDPQDYFEIGCGPGPKMLVARDLFGLDSRGIDREQEYVAAACSLGLSAAVADAETWTGYGRADITWFNRVARPGDLEARIEAAVWRGIKPGGVVMCANLESPPGGWEPVLDDWADRRRGIWRKPS